MLTPAIGCRCALASLSLSWPKRLATALAALFLLLPIVSLAQTQVLVTTEHNDNSRTGQNVNETILTPANVNVSQFGKLFSYPVDGYIYAQPLYVPNVTIPGQGVHNVIYVVTEHDSVYAFDADSNTGSNGGLLWHQSLINPAHGITTISAQDLNCEGITPEVGITSTPVIDTSTNTMYVLTEMKVNGDIVHRLQALDIATDQEKYGAPVTIRAHFPGTGDGSSGGILTFDPAMELNRPGLLVDNGNIYITWSSNCDISPTHGWVLAYDKTTLRQKSTWVTTSNGRLGGIWASGGGPAEDGSGNVFLSTGNGTFDTSGDPVDFGDSVVRLVGGHHYFTVADYFTPYDQATLYTNDKDVGSGGVLLLPDQPGPHVHELIAAGKEGSIYVIDRDNMGHYNPDDNSQIVQNIVGQVGGIFSTPAYWNGNVYFGGFRDELKAFSLSGGLLSTTPTSESAIIFGAFGTTASVSSNGSSDGIVWALNTDARQNGGNEVLYAFDATNLGNELYDTTQNASRDTAGGAVKFAKTTIANGKVYVGAAQQLSVYGRLIPAAAAPTYSPAWGTYISAQTVTISDATPGAIIYYTTDGSQPTTSSPVYTEPISVSATTTVKAIATASLYLNSPVSEAVYTITTGGGGAVNYGNGFDSTNLAINGSASINGGRLRLTDGGSGETSSVWYTTPVNAQAFTQDFSFQLTNAVADGITFTIQKAGTAAIGPGGAGLGYGASTPTGNLGIPTSVAIKFDIYNNFGEGMDSTGMYTEGASPTIPAVDMSNSGIDLGNGDIYNVHMTYDGFTLTMTMTDTATYGMFTQSWQIDIPTTIGGTTAYIGFTGASGAGTAIQDILNWTFASPTAINYGVGFTPTGLAFNLSASLQGTTAQLTDGGAGEIASVWYTTPVNVQSFTQDFSILLTNANGDGMTFTVQNAGTGSTGPGGAGLGYGQPSPGHYEGIPTSVAVKFDLYNNLGEGNNSTGLYLDGASPTVPAIDMTSSGVDLHSGDVLYVHMVYDGTTLTWQVTDRNLNKVFQTSWDVDIPSVVGGDSAYVGFTAGTGGATATQKVLTWTYTH